MDIHLPTQAEDMWCYACEHTWHTPDYFKTAECPTCHGTKIYRQSSMTFMYAVDQKRKEQNPPKVVTALEVLHTPYAIKEAQADELLAVIVPALKAGKEVHLHLKGMYAVKRAMLQRLCEGARDASAPEFRLVFVDVTRVPAWQQMVLEIYQELWPQKAA